MIIDKSDLMSIKDLFEHPFESDDESLVFEKSYMYNLLSLFCKDSLIDKINISWDKMVDSNESTLYKFMGNVQYLIIEILIRA